MADRKYQERKSTTLDVHVGKQMRKRRLELGLTQAATADKIGVSFQQLQKYEKGANRISIGRLDELARLFDVPIQFFLAGFDRKFVSEAHIGSQLPEQSDREALRLQKLYFSVPDKETRERIYLILKSLVSSMGK